MSCLKAFFPCCSPTKEVEADDAVTETNKMIKENGTSNKVKEVAQDIVKVAESANEVPPATTEPEKEAEPVPSKTEMAEEAPGPAEVTTAVVATLTTPPDMKKEEVEEVKEESMETDKVEDIVVKKENDRGDAAEVDDEKNEEEEERTETTNHPETMKESSESVESGIEKEEVEEEDEEEEEEKGMELPRGVMALADVPNLATLLRLPDNKVLEKISYFEGDITRLQVDAIVNAANAQLMGGGGVDGAIHRAAGYSDLQKECRKHDRPLATGNAVSTHSCDLDTHVKRIIHAVGPICHRGVTNSKRAELVSCYKRSIEICEEENLRSVAFCCISTGIYGYENDDAAASVLHYVTEYLKEEKNREKFDRIVFVLFMEIDKKYYKGFIKNYAKDDQFFVDAFSRISAGKDSGSENEEEESDKSKEEQKEEEDEGEKKEEEEVEKKAEEEEKKEGEEVEEKKEDKEDADSEKKDEKEKEMKEDKEKNEDIVEKEEEKKEDDESRRQ